MTAAGVTAAELDTIIVGTCSPDKLLPATAVEVQAALGASRASAFDVNAACSSWIYGMQLAEGQLAAGNAETVLGDRRRVAEPDRELEGPQHVRPVRRRGGRDDRAPNRRKHRGILSTYTRSDGTLANLLYRPEGGAADPMTAAILAEGSHYVHMQGREVFKNAVRSMAEASARARWGETVRDRH